MKRYDVPGHARELTFSCYQRYKYFQDENACSFFLNELEKARNLFSFKLWAYVIMPNHIHLLIWPQNSTYKMSTMLQSIKGKTSTYYKKYLAQINPKLYESYLVKEKGKEIFKFWQAGGGFDRNLWNGKAIHNSIKYIENNPVRSNLVSQPEDWKWSSAFSRCTDLGVVPDRFMIPVLIK